MDSIIFPIVITILLWFSFGLDVYRRRIRRLRHRRQRRSGSPYFGETGGGVDSPDRSGDDWGGCDSGGGDSGGDGGGGGSDY